MTAARRVGQKARTVAAPQPQPPASPDAAVPSPSRGEDDVALSAFLVLLLATTVMSGPLHESSAAWVPVVLRALLIGVGLVAIRRRRVHAAVAALAAVVAGYALAARGEGAPLGLAARLVFYGAVGTALLARAFRPGRVTVHRILGAAAVYVLLAVAWGTAYGLLVVLTPGAVRAGGGPASLDDAMWLSFITITTTGYGDVLPASSLARSLAALEAMVGVLFPAIFISRLVSLVQGGARD